MLSVHAYFMCHHGRFTPFSNVKYPAAEKFSRESYHLHQSHESRWRIQAVRDHIPAFLPDDLQSVGYNRQCRQRFATSLHLLGNETELEAPIISLVQCLPLYLFSHQCIFCERTRGERWCLKTEWPELFSSWKTEKIHGSNWITS